MGTTRPTLGRNYRSTVTPQQEPKPHQHENGGCDESVPLECLYGAARQRIADPEPA